MEMKFELMSLMERFPFDSYLYSRYADFCLIGCGDFEQYRKSKMISSDLERNRNLITDPILHRVVKKNIRILQFCSQEEKQASMPIQNSYSSSDSGVPIASYLKPSHRLIPFFPFAHVVLSIITFSAYFIISALFENYTLNKYKDINEQSPEFRLLSMKTFSTIFYPFAVRKFTQTDFTKINESKVCLSTFENVHLYISNFYYSLPQIQSLNDYTFIFFQEYFYDNMIRRKNVCQSLNNLTVAFDSILNAYMINLHEQLNLIIDYISDLDNRIKNERNSYLIEIIEIAIVIAIVIIFLIILIVQVNFVFRKNPNVIKFFASRKRITSLLLERCVDSWDDLHNYIQSKKLYLLHLHSEKAKGQKMKYINLDSRISSTSSSMLSVNNFDYSSVYDESTSSSVSQSQSQSSSPKHQSIMNNADNDASSSALIYSTSTSATDENENENEVEEALTTNVFANQNQKNSEENTKIAFKNVFDLSEKDKDNQNDDVEDYLNDQNETDEDPIDLTINETMQQKPYIWIMTPICLFLSWIILIISVLLLMIPFFIRFGYENDLVNEYLYSCIQINQSINLIENTFFLLKETVDYEPVIFSNIHESILDFETNITQIFRNTNNCIQLREMVCASFDNLTSEISSRRPSNEELLNQFLPAFVDFGIKAISATFEYQIDPYNQIQTSSVISFFVDFVVISIFLIYFSIFFGSAMVSSFNSLYHFPEIFLKKKKSKKNKNNINDRTKKNRKNHRQSNIDEIVINIDAKSVKKIDNTSNTNLSVQLLPSSILSVASVIETDEIYSISENAAVCLSRPSPSFIGEKFNNVFPIIQNSQRESVMVTDGQIFIELREHLMPDRVKKKTFRSSTRKRGEFLITLLIEEGAVGPVKPAYMQESISERLMNYIPCYFAKSFSENNISDFSFNSTLLIFLRYDTSKSQSELERFFTLINTCIMNYTNFKIIKIDGGIILFCGVKKMNILIAHLFIRDIIVEDLNFSRSAPTKAPICFYVESFNSVSASINTEDEPFLELDFDDMNKYEALLFKIGQAQVAFDSNCYSPVIDMDEYTQLEQINFKNLSKNIKKISFEKYVKHFKKYL